MKRFRYPIGDCPVVIAKRMAIRETIRTLLKSF